jgi:hypothetical protein
MRSDDADECWNEINGNLSTDFGFVIDVHAHEPETLDVVPIKSDFPPNGQLRVYRSRTGGNDWEPLTRRLPEKDCYVTCCAMPWPSTHSILAESSLAQRAVRSTPRSILATLGRPLFETFLQCFR